MRNKAPLWESLILLLLVAAVLIPGGEIVRASYHSYLHAGVGEAVLNHGLQPENPYHANSALRYYTLYPALGVWLGRFGIGAVWGFCLINIIAALLFAPSLDSFGRALGLSWRARRCSFWAVLLGFNGIGWLGVFWPATTGQLADSLSPVMSLAEMTMRGHVFHWDQRLQAFLPKFLNVSSFAIALPFSLWAMSATLSEKRRNYLSAILPAALSLAFNPLVGVFTGICMVVFLGIRFSQEKSLRNIASWFAAGIAALVLALPFLLPAFNLGGEAGRQVQVALGGNPLGNFFGPLLLLLPLGLIGLRELSAPARARLLVAITLSAGLLLFGNFPWGNEYKFARLGGIFWAIAAGAILANWWESLRRRPG